MLDSKYGGVLIVFVQPPSSGSIEAKLSKWPVIGCEKMGHIE